MQNFYNWLVTPIKTAGTGRNRLAQLTRVSRAQILRVASELAWGV